jgi:hypothetical protein
VGQRLSSLLINSVSVLFVQSHNRTIWTPIVVYTAGTYDAISFEVSTGVASQSMIIGLYDLDGERPGDLLTSGIVDVAASGIKTFTFGTPLVLAAGIYWIAHNTTTGGTGVIVRGPGTTGQYVIAANPNAYTAAYTAYTEFKSYDGTLPATGAAAELGSLNQLHFHLHRSA